MFDDDIMSVAHQHTYCIRRKRDPVFLESRLFRDANMQRDAFRLYVQTFLLVFRS